MDKMNKRPSAAEDEDDLLRLNDEFLSERAKNPKMQLAAKLVKIEKPPRRSLFAKSKEKEKESLPSTSAEAVELAAAPQEDKTSEIMGEIHEKMLGNGSDMTRDENLKKISAIVLGDIVEKHFVSPKPLENAETSSASSSSAFPPVDGAPLQVTAQPGRSIFSLSLGKKMQGTQALSVPMETIPMVTTNPAENHFFGDTSAIVEDAETAKEVHKENVALLSAMTEQELLSQREKLIASLDPSVVALLAQRRRVAAAAAAVETPLPTEPEMPEPMETEVLSEVADSLPPSSAAVDILKRSTAEQWIHFDIIEKDKLEWMRDIPTQQAVKLKAGEKFEARFDWKGVLLPYSTEETVLTVAKEAPVKPEKDERELYLHGDEPHRPGYTLQEFFRLARSNVVQQRVAAFGAIAGILNIYNQGFYDQVLELPLTKIFFLLRFGFDDNTPALLEVVSKSLAFLFYNETDETLLDFIYDNPGCHWQPTLKVLDDRSSGAEDPTSMESLQRQMQQLQMSAGGERRSASISARVDEEEEETKTSMSDFQLAETDLMECLLRTNIVQRIYFVLDAVRPDNSTVSCCLKVLIRIARTDKDSAMRIFKSTDLVSCLWDNFLPGLEHVDTQLEQPPFYGYPQYLCLKLLRVLISQNLSIALRFLKMGLVEKLRNYLFNREDIKIPLIKVQIEALRILRCFLMLRADISLYKKFLPAFRYMLEWHLHHVIYEVGGPFLIRQHASALMAAISSGTVSGLGLEVDAMLGDALHDCCCNWFHCAARHGVQEFSQATLLATCLNALTWFTRNSGDAKAERLRNFNERYLRKFIESQGFVDFIKSLPASSLVLRPWMDRRNVHRPLPNIGAVLINIYGPQLVIPQTYPVFFLTALWRLLELQREQNQKTLLEALITPQNVEPLVAYLRALAVNGALNRYLATNFFAKMELRFVFQLLCFEGFGEHLEPPKRLQLVYNFLCCLTAEHIPEIEDLFERVIFNQTYMPDIDVKTLRRWRKKCLELVHPHYIVVSPTELTLSMPSCQAPILPRDWPYFQLEEMLQNYIDNVQQNPMGDAFPEREVLRMTFTFVSQLKQCNPNLEMVTPTEQLMYLMIAFMGPESEFLELNVRQLLRQQLEAFYAQYSSHTFNFDAIHEGKCKFENLYALFVDHFQAASYGDELFGSLVLVPLAQKYDNKWRRRVWSEYAAALRFLDCQPNFLMGGLEAYLEPPEQEESLVKSYARALNSNLLRPGTVPYRIAHHHVQTYRQNRLRVKPSKAFGVPPKPMEE